MSHQFNAGYFVGKPAWHGLGTVVADYPSDRNEAKKLAGLDWEPTTEPIYRWCGMNTDGTPNMAKVEGHKAIMRGDNVLHVASETYEVVEHDVMYDIAEGILAVDGVAGCTPRYETGICLDEGRRAVILINLGDWDLPGDPSGHTAYMYVATSHDESAALRAGGTDIRIVCANTEHAADIDAQQRGTSYTFKHTRNVRNRIDEAREAVLGTAKQLDIVRKEAVDMLRVKITTAQRQKFIEEYALHRAIGNVTRLKGRDLEALTDSPRIQKSVIATREALDAILQSETCYGINGTAYGLSQAVNQYLDYGRPATNQETLFSRTVLTPEPGKRLAKKVLRGVLATA